MNSQSSVETTNDFTQIRFITNHNISEEVCVLPFAHNIINKPIQACNINYYNEDIENQRHILIDISNTMHTNNLNRDNIQEDQHIQNNCNICFIIFCIITFIGFTIFCIVLLL